MENKLRDNLRSDLQQLRKEHEALMISYKAWRQRKKEIQDKLTELEAEELKLRVEIWRLARETGQTELGL